MKISKLIIAASMLCLSIGCFSSAEDNTNVVSETNPGANPPVGNNAIAAANAAVDPIEMVEVYPVATYSQDTPTDAMKTWVMATVNKDIPALRGILSAGSMQMFEKAAQEQGKTVGDILTAGAVDKISKEIPKFRNEKITGDTAVVEYKDETMNEFLAMPLAREDGKWKIAYDVFTQNLIRKLTEDMNKPAPKPRK